MSTIQVFGVFVENPLAIAAIIPITLILLYFIRAGKRKRGKFWLFVSRTLIYAALLIALASPFTQRQTLIEGEPFVKILVDNSSSFSLYNASAGYHVAEELKKYIDVDLKEIGDLERSALGDEILESMESHESMLLVTDGNSNFGTNLGDVALHAARNNVSLNMLEVDLLEEDSSVSIIGPDKVTLDVTNVFVVRIDKTDPDKGHRLVVIVDGEEIFNQVTKDSKFEFRRKFGRGYHTIEAAIDSEDYFPQNNVYYKTIKAIEKPRVYFYTQRESPMIALMDELYQVDVVNNLDGLSNAYQALVINDIGAEFLDGKVEEIRNFVSDGNGLLVIGGLNSYEYGKYEDSRFESLLPVTVGSAEAKDEKVNIVIVLDISASTGTPFGYGSVGDAEKALALGAIEDISGNSLVGVVAFNTNAYVVSPLSPLKDKKEELAKQIRSLVDVGSTYLPAGLERGIQMIESAPGGKNLIIISDGISGGIGYTEQLAATAASKGISVVAVSVGGENIGGAGGSSDSIYGSGYMKTLARAGSGTYFRSKEAPQKIKVLFGDQAESKDKVSYPLLVFDEGHFVTEDLELKTSVSGFNQVLPKTASKMLVTADSGEPILTVWRFGLGRIASLSTDDGSKFAGNLLGRDGSALVSRTTNWVIGDPERGLERYVTAEDARINGTVSLIVKSHEPPVDEDIVFYKIGEDLYRATLFASKPGFNEVYGATYAVNYKAEYEEVSINDGLKGTVERTGGRTFKPGQIKEMIEAIQSQSKRTIEKKIYYRWIFIIAALMIFLIEICIRRVAEFKK